MRRIPFYPLLITLLVSFGSYLGCDPHQVEQGIELAVEEAARSGRLPAGFPLPNSQAPPPNYPNSGYPNQGFGNNGYANSGYGSPGYANTGYANNGYANPGYASGGYPNHGFPNSPYGNPAANTPYANNGYAGTGYSHTGYANNGITQNAGQYAGYHGNAIPTSPAPQTQISSTVPQRTGSTILVGSFNMQRLGPSKLADPWVMERFADIIRCFDVIALQEITSSDPNTLPVLLQYVNRNGARYSFTISNRVGRAASGYYEQYAYVFDTARVVTNAESCYVVQDPQDMLHREPHVGRFRTLVNSGPPFSFTLVNIHTDPDEISTELNVLANVLMNVAQFELPEDDVILMGDLNADPAKLQQLGQLPGIYPTIQRIATNTKKTKTLDNILINTRTTGEYTNRSGTLDLTSSFSISQKDAERISDHMPVWAEFQIFESGSGQVASQSISGIFR